MQMAHMKFKPHKLRGLILFLKSRQILKYLSNIRLMLHCQTGQTRMSLEGNTKVQDTGASNHFHQILHFQKQKQRATAHWILLFVCLTQTDISKQSPLLGRVCDLSYANTTESGLTSVKNTQKDTFIQEELLPPHIFLQNHQTCFNHSVQK